MVVNLVSSVYVIAIATLYMHVNECVDLTNYLISYCK